MNRASLCAALTLLGSLAPAAAADGKFDDFLKYVPEGANLVAALDVQSVRKSAVANKNNWAQSLPTSPVLPNGTQGVMAMRISPDAGLALRWQVGILALNKLVP